MLTSKDLEGIHLVGAGVEIWMPMASDEDVPGEDDPGEMLVRIVRIDGVTHAFWSTSWGGKAAGMACSRDDHPRRPRRGQHPQPIYPSSAHASHRRHALDSPGPFGPSGPEGPEWPFALGLPQHERAFVGLPDGDLVCNFIRRPQTSAVEIDDVLCAIDERTNLVVLEFGVEWYDRLVPDGPTMTVMPLDSGSNVPPGMRQEIVARPVQSVFRPRRIVIGGAPGDWIVHDIRIGQASQLAGSTEGLPGALFSPAALDVVMLAGPVSPSQNLALTISYVGDAPGGAPFHGAVFGEMDAPGPAGTRTTRARHFVWRHTPQGLSPDWMIRQVAEDPPGGAVDGLRDAMEKMRAGDAAAQGLALALGATSPGVPSTQDEPSP